MLINYLWEIIINIVIVLLFCILFHNMLEQKTQMANQKIYKFMFILITITILSILNFCKASTLYTTLLCFGSTVLYALLFYNGNTIYKIFLSVLYTIFCLVADEITLLLPTIVLKQSLSSVLAGGFLRFPCTLLYITFTICFTYSAIHLTNRKIFLNSIEKIIFIAISIFYICMSEVILTITLSFYMSYGNTHTAKALSALCILFVLSFLILLFYVYRLGISRYDNLILMQNEQQYELEKQEYKNLIETAQKLRTIKHDYSLHMEIISSLLMHHKYSELKKYVSDYSTSLTYTPLSVSTGNYAIDSIISAKMSEMEANNINFTYTILLPKSLPIDDISLCSLLGNILNNSIEACQKLQADVLSKISLTIQPYQEMLTIHLVNTSDGKYTFSPKGTLLSSKDAFSHGIGLKHVQQIVEDANGFLVCSPSENSFTIDIVIPLEN